MKREESSSTNRSDGSIRCSVTIVTPTSPPDQFDRSKFDRLTLSFAVFTTASIPVVVIVAVAVVVVVVVAPPPPPAAAATSTLKYPAGAGLNTPGAVKTNGCPGALLAVASRL
jgi:hypothetical protein